MLCPVCEADLVPEAAVCFRCGNVSKDPQVNPFAAPTINRGIDVGTSSAMTTVSILVTVGMVLILVAVGYSAPGLGICLALMTIPPWVRTTLVVVKRKRSGLPTSKLATASMLFGSALVTWAILAVALVSCFLTFCAACWIVLINDPRSSQNYISWVLIGTLVGTFVVILLAFTPWIRSRWKRDTTKD